MNGTAVVFGRGAMAMPAGNSGRGGIGVAAAVFILAATLLIIFAPALVGAVSVKPGDAAPDFTVRTLGGDEVSLRDYAGRVVLVAFWSSWCSRCREEFAFLRGMQAKYPGLAVLALNAETERPTAGDIARMRDAVKTWEMPVAVAVDEGLRVWSRYGVNALPTSMIVGVDGTVLFIEPNFYFASPEAIDAALGAAFGGVGDASPAGQADPADAGTTAGAGGLEGMPESAAEEVCRKELCLLAEPVARP